MVRLEPCPSPKDLTADGPIGTIGLWWKSFGVYAADKTLEAEPPESMGP